jgi:hypothetical protein
MFVFVDHGLRLLFSIRFGVAVSLVVRLVTGREGVGGEGRGRAPECATGVRWDHGIAAEVLVLVLLVIEMGRLCKMGSCVLNFSSISDCKDVDVGTVWCVCV